MFNTVSKTNSVNDSTLFTLVDKNLPEKLLSHLAFNWINVVSLDAQGDPVIPTAGKYEIYVKTTDNTGFEKVDRNIPADKTGGELMEDGDERGS